MNTTKQQILSRLKRIIFVPVFTLIGMTAHSQCGLPGIDLGPDTLLCAGQILSLDASGNGANYDKFKWENNSTNPNRTINSAGTYDVTGTFLGPNVIVNGDFEAGNTGFTTGYTYGTGGGWGLLSNAGEYAVVASPNLAHNNFPFCNDHTAAPGTQMMVVNGSASPGLNVWCQTVNVTPNTTYQFSSWVSNALNEFNVAQLQFSINGIQLGPVFTTATTGCTWQQFFQTWNSGTNTTANLCILNQNVGQGGNDFLLDDISFQSECYAYDTIVVNYAPNPVVNLGPNQNHCYGTTTLLDAQNPTSSFLWNDGSTNSTLLVDTTGNYQVTVTDTNFCVGSGQVNVNFEIQKDAGADMMETWCVTSPNVNLSTYLSPTATAGGVWENALGSTATNLTTAGGLTITGNAGTQQANYIVSGTYCPNDTSLFDITIHDQSIGDAPTSLSLCNTLGQTSDFNAYVAGVYNVLPAYWEEGSVLNSNQFNTVTGVLDVSNLSAGNYVFNYISPADAPCLNDTTEVLVAITEHPTIAFDADKYKGCNPMDVTFSNQSTSAANSFATWRIDGIDVSNDPLGFSQIFDVPGCYDVTLSILANNLCSSEMTMPDFICVDPLPVASFTSNVTSTFSDDPSVIFTNTSYLNDLNQWNFGDSTFSGEIHPEHQFPLGEVGNYVVTLIVTTSEGCKDTTFSVIEVKDQLLYYVPNSFTPDGDEFNAVFKPVLTTGFDPASFEMTIYDRWGKVIFVTHDPEIGWDGTLNQRKVQSGVYAWRIQFKMDKTDDKILKTGHVNVMN